MLLIAGQGHDSKIKGQAKWSLLWLWLYQLIQSYDLLFEIEVNVEGDTVG